MKPFVADVPAPAPRYKYGGPADFHAWTGHHLEDNLNESTIKNGLYDKPQASQNESATARPAVWSSLRHKSGLRVLSSLLISALEQRRAHGTIAANCTFKPPPRVTLTDTKREAWLHDLANPDIPLRRLSRTIPHGIRGKALLEHCLSKVIPIARALWLTKCVGANEIRAFRRKGAGGAFAVGGEAKWIKDWTINVEQFAEMVASKCGDAEWTTRIEYGLRLVSHLVSEQLLDRVHYFNWIISSIQDNDLDDLFLWILIAQMNYGNLLQQRQLGKRFVQVLLEKLHEATEPFTEGVHLKVALQLTELIRSALISSPDCFLSPSMWRKYEVLLRREIRNQPRDDSELLDHLSRRNKGIDSRASLRAESPYRQIVDLLDTTDEDIEISTLAESCLGHMPDVDALVNTCLQWGSSLYRIGNARVYKTVRLLRRWCAGRVRLDASITKFLSSSADHVGLSRPTLFRILAELFRSKHLSVGKYLQWLMAKGGMTGLPASAEHLSCDVRLLLEVPTCGLPRQVLNLRDILLSKLGVSSKYEDETTLLIQNSLANQVPSLFSKPTVIATSETPVLALSQLSIPVKSTVTLWMRQALASRLDQQQEECDERDGRASECSPLMVLTLDEFKVVRRILEELEDFTILADVLKMVATSEDISILAYTSDTVNGHASVFAAIGALHELFHILLQQYKDISNNVLVHQDFVESLIDLGKRIPNATKEVGQLRAQIQLYRQRAAAAVCSPISDHMNETTQSVEVNLSDELDQVLSSGTIIDRPNLTRLFERITRRWEQADGESKQSDLIFPGLLSRLQPLDPANFEVMMISWIGEVLRSMSLPKVPIVLLSIISSGCVTLDKVLIVARDVLRNGTEANRHTSIAMDVLELSAIWRLPDYSSFVPKAYRFNLQQFGILQRSPSLAVPFLLRTIEGFSCSQIELSNRARTLIFSAGVQDLVKTLALRDPRALQGIGSSTGAALLLNHAIFPHDQSHVKSEAESADITQLLTLVNHYNMSLCQLRLSILLSSDKTAAACAAATLSNIFKSDADHPTGDLWPELASELPSEQSDCIRQSLEREILSRLSFSKNAIPEYRCAGLNRTLAIIEAIGAMTASQTSLPILVEIADKLSLALSACQLAAQSGTTAHEASSPEESSLLISVNRNLDILLRLVRTYLPTLREPRFPQSTLTRLLLPLTFLFIHPSLSMYRSLISRTYDTLLLLSDILSEDSRCSCTRMFQHHQIRNPQVRFIFGFPESADDDWLQVVTDNSVTSTFDPTGDRTQTAQPYPIRRWEMMQDATPLTHVNDSSLSLTLFGTRRSVI